MALLTYVRSMKDDLAIFAIVVDDSSAEYVWPTDVEPWFDAKHRIEWLLKTAVSPPADEQSWLALASQNLGDSVSFDYPFDMSSLGQARSTAKTYLKKIEREPVSRSMPQVEDAFDQVSQDYPGFGETMESMTPEAMNNFVMMALGPIDPDGPNGWILRAQDEMPAPGDENEFIHWPGTIEPEAEESAG